jgi:hypothetical protein
MKIANCVDIWIIVILTDFLTNNQRSPIKNCAMRIFGVKPLNAMAVNVPLPPTLRGYCDMIVMHVTKNSRYGAHGLIVARIIHDALVCFSKKYNNRYIQALMWMSADDITDVATIVCRIQPQSPLSRYSRARVWSDCFDWEYHRQTAKFVGVLGQNLQCRHCRPPQIAKT